MSPPPKPDAQLVFLSKLQRLFSEGDFTATYKFALLSALADLAVERGRDDGDRLRLTHRTIAATFVDLYWQQTAPYSRGPGQADIGVLAQNNGAQAAVVRAIAAFRQRQPHATVQSARAVGPAYDLLLQDVARTVAAQPIRYLQNMGGQEDAFLYKRERGAVVLEPGVMYCLRRFQPLVQQLARTHWVGHIKRNRLNVPLLGAEDDLESFLFETSRQTLRAIGEGLRPLTNSRCFYCRSVVYNAEVDHFIPFSIYPRDLMHNFVLAHAHCNGSKADTLAARPHLDHWMEHITRHDDALREIGERVGRLADRPSSVAVARWGYANAFSGGARAWLKVGTYMPVGADYMNVME